MEPQQEELLLRRENERLKNLVKEANDKLNETSRLEKEVPDASK